MLGLTESVNREMKDAGDLIIVSYFVFQISNFMTEKTEFSVKH